MRRAIVYLKRANTGTVATAPAVILTDDQSRGALDLLRALAYDHIDAIVASPDPDEIAATSRFCRGLVRLQRYGPETDIHNVNVLSDLARHSASKQVLFYGDDAEMMFISRNRTILSQYFSFLLPDPVLAVQLVNKVAFQELAESHHLPVPATRFVHSYDDLLAFSSQFAYPVFVKPALPDRWTFTTPEQAKKYRSYKHAIRQFYSQQEMVEYCRHLPIAAGGILVQEFIPGSEREVYSFHGYFDEHSNIVGYFVGRKIRTYPIHHGGSAFIETVDEPAVAKICIESLETIGFKGVAKVDLKRDPRDGSFKILEVNPRYTLWVSLGAFAGMNLPVIAYRHQRTELRGKVEQRYRVGYKWLFVKQDLRSFFSGFRQNERWSVVSYLLSLRGKKVYQFFDRRDPVPFFISCARFWMKNFGRAFRRISSARVVR
ncbi:MAG TPA: hypothetical protein VI758_07885 [Bacteroidota bacterium]